MPARRSSPSKAKESPNRSSAEWPASLGAALSELRVATTDYPKLFPHGITKIDLELRVAGNTTARLLVEGKLQSPERLLTEQLATAFEFIRPPESLRILSSPGEGTAEDQKKLTAGTTIEGSAKVFNRDCLKKVSSYENNCAHYLSDAFIEAGFAELAQPHDCITSGGRCGPPNCTSSGKRPIRAKDIRCWFVTKDSVPVSSVKSKTGFYAVYQERQSDGQGHVVILDSNAWKFYGTGWFEAGLSAPNDWEHEYYQW